MSETFTIKVDGNGDDIYDCQYFSKPVPRIMIPEGTYFTRQRCESILRELAKRSDEKPGGLFEENEKGEPCININKWLWSEQRLEGYLHDLRLHKYQQTPLTDKEKIEKVINFLNKFDSYPGYNRSKETVGVLKILESQ